MPSQSAEEAADDAYLLTGDPLADIQTCRDLAFERMKVRYAMLLAERAKSLECLHCFGLGTDQGLESATIQRER